MNITGNIDMLCMLYIMKVVCNIMPCFTPCYITCYITTLYKMF